MAEAIHCPSCSTRYRLRPERLRPALRRARCFSCGSTFPVGEVVQRALGLPAPEAVAGFEAEALEALRLVTLPPQDLGEPPALTLEDLPGSVTAVLDQTLPEFPAFLPEAKEDLPIAEPVQEAAPPAEPPPLELPKTTASGYTSARDAIDKLFGDAPAEPTGLRISRHPGDMDMEATLSALDSTLAPPQAVVEPEPELPPVSAPSQEDGATASGYAALDPLGPSSSTVRISQADLLAALASVPASAMEEPTVAFEATDLLPPPEELTEMIPAPRSFAPLPEGPDTGAELLRLKIGEEIYGGLTMPQLIAWVDEGRILENHVVARQHSENWLEAYKVPGLRPAFDRLRRERTGGTPTLPPAEESAPKKGLFSGLFGRH